MDRLRLIPVMVSLFTMCSCVASSGSFVAPWKKVDFTPDVMGPPPNVVEVDQTMLRLNGREVDEGSLTSVLQSEVSLVPAPAVYLRFHGANYGEAVALAKRLQRAGACAHQWCVFNVDDAGDGSIGHASQLGSNPSLERP